LTLQAGITLAAARKLCSDALHEVAQGRDPSEAKKAAKVKAAAAAVNTLRYVCEEYFKREHHKLRTAGRREYVLKRLVFPTLGDRQINTIKRSEINRLLDHLEDNHGACSANQALQLMRRNMNWHATRDDDFRSPIIIGMGRWSATANARSRVLDDAELKTVWEASKAAGYFGALVRFVLLTAARRGEAANLCWKEIGKDGNWFLPAAKNKTNVNFVRPLSKAAQAILAGQPRLGDFVFTFNGRRAISFGRCKREFTKQCGIADRWTLHDLRRTARTLLSRAGVDVDIAERCLGHSVRGVRGIYDRHPYHDEMRSAFEALSAQIERIVNPPLAEVVQLRRQHSL
jgi:integrase